MSRLKSIQAAGRLALALLLAGLAGTSAAAPVSYHVQIDTTGLSGSGWLDLVFVPGQLPAAAATARISGVQGDLGAVFTREGDVSGSLGSGPGEALLFGNQTGFNDQLQALNLGGLLRFDVSFDWSLAGAGGGGATVGSSFGIGLLSDDLSAYLGGAGGNLIDFNLSPAQGVQEAQIEVLVHAPALSRVSAVPEPGTLALAALALLALLATQRPALRQQATSSAARCATCAAESSGR